jgi:hypothetical protein
MTKTRFFREKLETENEEIDWEIPGRNLYVSPYTKKNVRGNGIEAVEESLDFDENVTVTYKRNNNKFFTCARKDLPQFFVDSRVQVRMTQTMGKGCFALEKIEKNTVVESAPVILLHRDTFVNLNTYNDGTHKLSEYPFGWGRDGLVAFSLGYGGIYNHKVDPNLSWRPNYENESIQYTAVRDIEAGEELFIRYVPLYKLGDLWFVDEESERYAKAYEISMKEDPGTIKSWKMFKPGERLPKID